MWLKRVVDDFRHFFWHHKAWWITPIVVVLLALALLAVLSDDTGVVPFIYSNP